MFVSCSMGFSINLVIKRFIYKYACDFAASLRICFSLRLCFQNQNLDKKEESVEWMDYCEENYDEW